MLDVLAGRNDGGSVEGDMFLNGVPWTRQMVRSCSAYVRQDDRLLAHLTVKETLMFVAQLKLPSAFSKEDIENRVKPYLNLYNRLTLLIPTGINHNLFIYYIYALVIHLLHA